MHDDGRRARRARQAPAGPEGRGRAQARRQDGRGHGAELGERPGGDRPPSSAPLLRCPRDAREDLRHHPPRGRRARRRARRLGDRDDPLAAARRAPAIARHGGRDRRARSAAAWPASASSSTRRSTRSRTRPSRSASATCSCTATRARRSAAEVARRTGCKVIKAAQRGDRGRHPRRSSASTPTSTCSTPPRPACAAAAGADVGVGLLAARRSKVPLILSGGLGADNVAEAIAAAHPWAVDSASGTEAAPGVKDPEKVAALPRDRRGRRGAAVVMTAVEHRFGPYGGQFVPETLMPALAELEAAWVEARADAGFQADLAAAAARLRGPPDAAVRGAAALRGASAARSGSSARTCCTPARTRSTTRSARRCWPSGMGKTRIIAETGAGQHGVASATACALLGLECIVYMGTEDMRRQQPNVQRMGLLGATVVAGRGGRADAQGGRVGARSATGSPTSPTPTTSSARASARRRSRRSCATSSA